MKTRGLLTLLMCLGFSVPVMAQDDAEDASNAWSWFGDLRLRIDHVQDLAGREDIERNRGRVRFGARRMFGDLEFGIALEGALGSDDNGDNRRNNDNERSDAVNLDEFYLRWNLADETRLLVGRTALPLSLTPMLWDSDLRPIGASVSHDIATGDFDRLALTAGYFAGTHLYEDDSRIAALQAGWFLREGTDFGGDIQIAWLDFSDLEQLTLNGLSRTNRRTGAVLLSDYEIVDLQAGLHTTLAGWPLALRADVARNLGADDQNEAGRFSAVLGDKLQAMGWEYGYAVQRIQRDAAMAAFNEDDWWFHSFAKGHMLWVGYGIDETWNTQFSMFRENRDGVSEDVDRFILELNARW
ncbi:MAG TPA: putative porin [Patescibacteria group bacterium]|nr:putative porin [Patescibacteria group bacterium]